MVFRQLFLIRSEEETRHIRAFKTSVYCFATESHQRKVCSYMQLRLKDSFAASTTFVPASDHLAKDALQTCKQLHDEAATVLFAEN